ncbi:MAG: sugar ABC transporter ATP-binding protein [Sphaerochaetaceae bacterium]|jgi:ribose transport system ATP-binding protein|nr:sugar ABC transporter ATP-binding protein [Sphaerochaetaceae bacterium]
MKKTILEMNAITKFIFDEHGQPLRGTTVKILEDVHFDVKEAEVHVLVGENGAGKSTLMKIIGGIIPADEGEMLLDGEVITFAGPRESLAHGIGFIHQELNLCLNLDVAQNIFLGRERQKKLFIDKASMYTEAREMLLRLGFDIDPKTMVRDLSTAQQQIVEIVKVLSYDCRIIIMDEPTASLTKSEIDKLFAIIHDLRRNGISIIYISHRFEELKEIGDRITVLRDGRYIGTVDIEDFDYDKIISMMVGRKLGAMFQSSHQVQDEVVLEVKGLRISRNTEPINLYVRSGEVVGLSGLVGAGRTELGKSIFGSRTYYGGEILYMGEEIGGLHPSNLIEKGVIYLSEDRKLEGLVLDMSLKDNMTMASLKRMYPKTKIDFKREEVVAQESIDKLNIVANSVEQICNTLSGGNQQKVVVAKWLLTNPKLLILDEPTRGIDVNAKSEIYKIIDQLASQGVAILMISSELPEIIGMSDRIYVMKRGAIAAELTDKREFIQEKILSHTL